MRVLLADDSDLILERLEEMIGLHKDFEIVGLFKNGTETLKALGDLKPDLAIIDFRMSEMTGLEVISEFRKTNTSVIFIMITFYATSHLNELAMKAGANYFLSKVDDFEKLECVLSEIVLNIER